MDDGGRGPKGGPVELNIFSAMEDVLDRLKILNYEKFFCAARGYPHLSRTFFAMPAANTASQFACFIALIEWLLKLCQRSITFDKYDDPNTSINNLVLELKNMGFAMDFPPSKLKQPHGEAVCSVLGFATSEAIKLSRFKWEKPRYPREELPDAEIDDGDVDAEVDASAAGVFEGGMGEEDEEILCAEVGVDAEEQGHRAILENTLDVELWKTELERVGPRLKVAAVDMAAGGREWRAHLEQTKQHESAIDNVLPDAAKQLRSIIDAVSGALDRVSSKERHLATQFDVLIAEYTSVQSHMRELNASYSSGSQSTGALTNELAALNDRLDEVKSEMDGRGSSMVDTSPLAKIKKSLKKLKDEIMNMELRIGVVGHTLMQVKAGRSEAPVDHSE